MIGPRHAREAQKHFGPAPGVPHSHAKYVCISYSAKGYDRICLQYHPTLEGWH